MNLANKITLSRFPLTLLLLIAYSVSFFVPPELLHIFPTTHFTALDLACCLTFALIAATDGVDGHIARSRGMVTDFGKFMDPLADKFLIDGALIMLSAKMPWLCPPVLTVLLVGRDVMIDGVRMIAAKKGVVIPANLFGKAKTLAETIYIPFLFLRGFPFSYVDYFLDREDFLAWSSSGSTPGWQNTLGNSGEVGAMVWLLFLGVVTTLLSLTSGAIYACRAKEILKESAK